MRYLDTYTKKLLSKTIGKMIKPIVKLLIYQGITYTGLQSLLKEIFVEVADTEPSFHIRGKRQTDSRISLLTGVHRKEIKRIRGELALPQTRNEIKASLSAQMISLWLGHPDFLDDEGRPKPLHRQHETETSFADLVFSVSKDKHPRSILDDWLNQALISIDEDNRVHLIQTGFIAKGDMEEKLFFAEKNTSEHLQTITHNLIATGAPLFDRAVYYHHLTDDSVRELEKMAQENMLTVLTDFNKKAAELQRKDSESSDKKNHYSIHLGAYLSHDLKKRP